MAWRIFGLPASGQAHSAHRTIDWIKKVANGHLKHAGEGFQHIDSDVLGTPFDATDIRTIDVTGQGKTFLRQAARHPEASHICTDGLSRIHATAPKHFGRLTIDGLSVPYCGETTTCHGATTTVLGPYRYRRTAAVLGTAALVIAATFGGTYPSFGQSLGAPLNLIPSEMDNYLRGEQLEGLTGLWRGVDDPVGCTDEDGKGSVRVGRFDFTQQGTVVMGKGPPRLGFYEALCELSSIEKSDGRLEMHADCVNEGEPAAGRASIEVVGTDVIRIETPALSGTFKACGPEQVDGIAVLAGLPPAAPNVVPLRTEALTADARPNLDPQRNAVAMVIADYCQPDFYETGHWGNGDWDPGFYDRYKQQLLVRYLSNCDEFQKTEYFPFTFIDEVLANNPGLFPPGRATLSIEHAFVAGYYLRVANLAAASQCDLANTDNIPSGLVPSMNTVLNTATSGDQLTIALGYGFAKMSAEQQASFGAEPSDCRPTSTMLNILMPTVFTSGIVPPQVLTAR